MEFCDQSWNLTNFDPKLCQICIFLVPTKKFSSDLESPHFLMFSAKCCECKIRGKKWSLIIKKWSGKSHGKSVGTLIIYITVTTVSYHDVFRFYS